MREGGLPHSIMKIYLIIGTILALLGYNTTASKYNFISAILIILGWPIIIAYLVWRNTRRPNK